MTRIRITWYDAAGNATKGSMRGDFPAEIAQYANDAAPFHAVRWVAKVGNKIVAQGDLS